MIVRIRQVICNVPVVSTTTLLAFILSIVFSVLWLPAEVHWRESIVILALLIVVFIMDVLLFLRWCIAKNNVIICQTLFRKVEMSRATTLLTFKKDWYCTFAEWFSFCLFAGSIGLYDSEVSKARWIVLEDSARSFTIGLSELVHRRFQTMTDIIDVLTIKTKEIDLSAIKSTTDRYQPFNSWPILVVLVVAQTILFLIFMTR